jgi:Rad3-related DNA helicase
VQTIREIVQMTGRGVRSETDSCTTYIIDGAFGKLWTRNKSLFPSWWREAVDTTQSSKWLMG